MLKMMTWASIGLSLLGALVDLARPGASGGEDAAEIALLARMVLSDGGAQPPAAPPATR